MVRNPPHPETATRNSAKNRVPFSRTLDATLVQGVSPTVGRITLTNIADALGFNCYKGRVDPTILPLLHNELFVAWQPTYKALPLHRAHHLGDIRVVPRPFVVIVSRILKGNLGVPGLGGLGHIEHYLSSQLVQLIFGRRPIKSSNLLLVFGGKIPLNLSHRLTGDGHFSSSGTFIFIDHNVADFIVETLEIALGVFLGIDVDPLNPFPCNLSKPSRNDSSLFLISSS